MIDRYNLITKIKMTRWSAGECWRGEGGGAGTLEESIRASFTGKNDKEKE